MAFVVDPDDYEVLRAEVETTPNTGTTSKTWAGERTDIGMGFSDSGYCRNSGFCEIAGGGFQMILAAFCCFLGILMLVHNLQS